jgi:MFS family permease
MLMPQSYLLFEVPSNMLLARSKPAIFLPSIMVTWGAVSIIVAAIHNLAGMVAFRFALGIIEAGFFPGVVSTSATKGFPESMLTRRCFFSVVGTSRRSSVNESLSSTPPLSSLEHLVVFSLVVSLKEWKVLVVFEDGSGFS